RPATPRRARGGARHIAPPVGARPPPPRLSRPSPPSWRAHDPGRAERAQQARARRLARGEHRRALPVDGRIPEDERRHPRERAEDDGRAEDRRGGAAVMLAKVSNVAQVVLDLTDGRLTGAGAVAVNGAGGGTEGARVSLVTKAPAEVRLLEVHPEALVEAPHRLERGAAEHHHRARHRVDFRRAREIPVLVVEAPRPRI